MAESGPRKGLLYTDMLPGYVRLGSEAVDQDYVFDPGEQLRQLLQLKRSTPCGAGNDDGDPTPYIDVQPETILASHSTLRDQLQ